MFKGILIYKYVLLIFVFLENFVSLWYIFFVLLFKGMLLFLLLIIKLLKEGGDRKIFVMLDFLMNDF